MGGIGRWGEGHSLDFWTALERGEVDDAEVRAVDLLRRTTDPFRFAYYCQTAMLPAMGNVTGRIYMLERGGAALELEAGQIVASWCISIGPHNERIPGTDQVVVLRNFVEGEEIEFMGIGNRSQWYSPYGDIVFSRYGSQDWLPDIFLDLSDEEKLESEDEEILELEELRRKSYRLDRHVFPMVIGNNQPLQGVVDVDPRIQGVVRRQLGAYLDRQQDPAQQYERYEAIEEMIDVHGPEIGVQQEILRQMEAQIPDWNEELREEQIQVRVDGVAMQDLIDIHGPEIGEEIAAAIQQEEGFADMEITPDVREYIDQCALRLNDFIWENVGAAANGQIGRQLYEPLYPVQRWLPDGRVEDIPAGRVVRRMPDGQVVLL